MEIETALKHRLPVCTLVWNNSSWGPSFDQMPMLRGRVDPFDMLPDLRYDRMFEAIGCHGEHVTEPDEIRPALARALASGKASVGNCPGAPRAGHPRRGGNPRGSTRVWGRVAVGRLLLLAIVLVWGCMPPKPIVQPPLDQLTPLAGHVIAEPIPVLGADNRIH